MAYEFKLPDLGEGLTEGEIARWLVAEGQELAEDDPLVEIQTDKTTVEIPSPAAGTVTIAVQVMGKLRGTIEVPVGADEAAVLAAAEAEENVARAIAGRTIRKRIHVPGKIVNFVL